MPAAALAGAVYYLEEPLAPWLWPLLDLCGIALQLAAVPLKKRWLLPLGLALLLPGAAYERDLALIIGDALATAGLFHCLRS